MHAPILASLPLAIAQLLTPAAALTRSSVEYHSGASTSETLGTAVSPLSTVTWRAVNHPVCASPIEFDIVPVAPLWTSEVLVYLNSSFPPPAVLGKVRVGPQAQPSHLTVFVDQAIFNQICGCLGGSAVDISIDYDDTLAVTNVFAVAQP